MPVFRMVEEGQADAAARQIFREILAVKHIRKIPNFFKTLANNATVLEGTWSIYRDVGSHGLIDEALKEMIFVAISAAKKCKYCQAAHLAFCRILNVDPESCENVARNVDALRPVRVRDIMRFAVKTATTPQKLTQKDYRSLKRHKLSDAEIIEIVAMSAFAVYAITVAEALKLEEDDWD